MNVDLQALCQEVRSLTIEVGIFIKNERKKFREVKERYENDLDN
jgi:hypothetical protein